jgi:hypothetical protein
MSSLSGSQTTTTKLSPEMEKHAALTMQRSQDAANVGFVPYSGPQVAAFTPMQQAAFDSNNMAASAFGLPTAPGTGTPAPTDFGGGMMGHSGMPLYQQALQSLMQSNPQQYNALIANTPGMQQAPMPMQSNGAMQPNAAMPQQAAPKTAPNGSQVYSGRDGDYFWDGKQFVRL